MIECACSESCLVDDQFQPATRELMVFTKSAKRYFDLNAVREPYAASTLARGNQPDGGQYAYDKYFEAKTDHPDLLRQSSRRLTHEGAPPLDWWLIPYTDTQPEQEPSNMTAIFHVGDAIEVMSKLPEKSVDLVLTSPPFLALRSYLPADHPDKTLEGGSQATPGEYVDWLLDVVEACARVLAPHGSLCFELGDTYSGSGGAGGDYAADGLREGQPKFSQHARYRGYSGGSYENDTEMSDQGFFIKGGAAWPLAKSLSLIPESFRFAMVYGHNPHTGRTTEPWRLRNVIRWVRPNPPVGALGDKFRPATSELMVFCKAKDRYFDLDATREPPTAKPQRFLSQSDVRSGRTPNEKRGPGELSSWVSDEVTSRANPAGAPPLDWWNIPLLEGEEPTPYGPKESVNPFDKYPGRYSRGYKGRVGTDGDRANAGLPSASPNNPLGAPPLDWWNIPPTGYAGAHYAVWPPELLIKPIKAMCPEQVCRTCGEARRRIVDVSYVPNPDGHPEQAPPQLSPDVMAESIRKQHIMNHGAASDASGNLIRGIGSSFKYGRATKNVETLGFSDCGHDDFRPGMVLDCFAGTGTTLAVATGHGRDAIGIDLDERNYELALDRVGPLILQRGTID